MTEQLIKHSTIKIKEKDKFLTEEDKIEDS